MRKRSSLIAAATRSQQMGAAASTTASRLAFRPAGVAPLPPGAAPPLVVVTWNILCNKYAGSQFSYCPPQFLAWQYRKQRCVETLLELRPDIVCLQEVERPFFENELEPLFQQHGYEALYYSRRRRPHDPPDAPEEGISLLYRTARLEKQASKAAQLGKGVARGMTGKFWGAVRARDDGVLLALLRDRVTRRTLLAGCTHLYWDPRFPDIKAAQAALVCRAATSFLRQQRLVHDATLQRDAAAIPLVIAGDFNSLPFKRRSDAFDTVRPGETLISGAYTVLASKEGIDSSHPDHPSRRSLVGGGAAAQALATLRLSSDPFLLQSASVAAWGREPPVTNKTDSFAGCLDYVWLSRRHWAVSAALPLPYRFDPSRPGQQTAVNDPSDVRDLPPLPSETIPSDHLPLAFKLHLVPT
ncbi:Glucose-repressible alcohol dehydrogenase transcriptional effector [Chlorella vulgaris]